MKENRYKGFVGLMGVSVLLLITLQLLWLRTEYRSAADSFNRETNLLFRTSARHLSDSLFFSRFRIITAGDSLSFHAGMSEFPPEWIGNGRVPPIATVRDSIPLEPGTPGDTSRHGGTGILGSRSHSIVIKRDSLEADTAGSRPLTMEINVRGHHIDSPFVSMPRQFRGNFMDFRQMINLPPDEVLAEILEAYYRDALDESRYSQDFEIISREVDWFRPGGVFGAQEAADSLLFTTSFVPFGRTTAFAASFSGVRPMLVRQLLPQIGFSVLITAMILLSFILIYRNLLSQQRLIAQKNDFIGNVTHELKTPVATVGVALEAMKHFDVLKDPQKTSEYLDMATQELNRLGMMTDKILKTSVLDYGMEIRMNSSPVDMEEIVRKVLASFSILADQKHCALRFEVQGSGLLEGNLEHLTQMVYNLVDNALKYGTGSVEIFVRLSDSRRDVLLEVADQGPGIPEEYRDKVFDKFFRVPSGNVHNVKGYGLGLNYVAGVVRAHGGRVRVDGGTGKGARFIVRLPKGIIAEASDENKAG
jgi:two-component system, OmpR family, phosphate regulon sensor histidine kinase PhoR